MTTKTKTVTFKFRGFSGFLISSVLLTLGAVLFVVALFAVPLFFLVWGIVALIDVAVGKVHSFRRSKAPTWQERKTSGRFIRR